MLTGLGCFFLDQWLWNITWGWYYLPINTLLFIFLLNFSAGMRLLRAFIMSVLVNGASFVMFSGAVVGGLIHAAGMEYVTSANEVVPLIIWRPVLFLCLLYIFIQSLLVYVTRKWYTPNTKRIIFLVFISNIIAAFFAYKFVVMRLY